MTVVKQNLVNIIELAHTGSELLDRVDAEAGVIFGVKVLGLQSQNIGRTLGLAKEEYGEAVERAYSYSPAALRKASALYEGIGVYVDHPEFSYSDQGRRAIHRRDRKTAERFGRLKNIRVNSQGMYADLEYLKSHPLANMVVEAARRMPETLALSHNAVGRPTLTEGQIVIEEIVEVRSVDLVSEKPGATAGLFESAAAAKTSPSRGPSQTTAPQSTNMLDLVDMLSEAGLPVERPLLEALAALPTTELRDALIESWPRPSESNNRPGAAANGFRAPTPRSQSADKPLFETQSSAARRLSKEPPAVTIAALRG